MKWLIRSIPRIAVASLLALVEISCSSTNTPVSYSLAPTITGFSPDTAWTFRTLTIHGTNFGYDIANVLVLFDTAPVYSITDIEDTMMKVTVPEAARTGFLRVWSYEQTATSAKPVVINYTFTPHSLNDTLPDGHSFSIPGTGMNNYHGFVRLSIGGLVFPIDSVFPNRIVSHVPSNSSGGSITMADSNGTYYSLGTLTVTRPSAWTTLSEIFNRMTVIEFHQRSGYTDGPGNPIDSTWRDTVTYDGQHDLNIAGIPFEKTVRGLQYTAQDFQIVWDTISQTATVRFQNYSYIPPTQTHSLDTTWSAGGQTQPAALPVDNDIEFTLSGFGYEIAEDSTDSQGLVNWQEQTATQVISGDFDIILKH